MFVMDYTYKFYYRCLPDDLQKQIIDMWVSEGALTLERAKKRINEVVLVMFDPNNEVCGVTTVYVDLEKAFNKYFYYLRMFIKEKDRGKIKSFKASKVTYEHLKTYESIAAMVLYPYNPVGIIAIAENVKITQRKMKQEEWNYYGKNNMNLDVYYVLF
jgi:hypothetical protein